MKTSTISSIIIALIVLGLGWYFWPGLSNQTPATPSTQTGVNDSTNQTNTGQQSVAPVLAVATDATLGSYITASNGMTLYLYTKDTAGVSNCYDACAVSWPPYSPSTLEALVTGAGINGQLSTITRKDGTTQLAYNGMPLYFWKNDKKVGDTTGQNVGGVWFVVKP